MFGFILKIHVAQNELTEIINKELGTLLRLNKKQQH